MTIFPVRIHWPSSSSSLLHWYKVPGTMVYYQWAYGFLSSQYKTQIRFIREYVEGKQWDFLLWKAGLTEFFFSLGYAEQIKDIFVTENCQVQFICYFLICQNKVLCSFPVPNQSPIYLRGRIGKEGKEDSLLNRVCCHGMSPVKSHEEWDLTLLVS